MDVKTLELSTPFEGVVFFLGEKPKFQEGDLVRLGTRTPVGHYRVPIYVRGAVGRVETVIEPAGLDNEEEGYGRNAGRKLHYYRIAIPMAKIWPDYSGASLDEIRIEVFENWLERI